ncbi:type II secretion system protein [Neptuniibacter sp. SY11_33]|uniref:type II secretion system protein n=1 Tax=Neptuniibacter sp. SY11_33 TaxID=3398215 RepID=UPI0039F61607
MSTLIPNICPTQKQSGFTLLELVLVMLIIGLVASTPLVFIDNQDNQLRYDETLDKMELLRKSILMQNSYRNQPVLSGFIIDNGVLPPASATLSQDSAELQPLINKDGSWEVSGSDQWIDLAMLDPYVNFGGTPTQISAYPQLKGYRANYLNSGLDSNREFRDGWGIGFEVSNASDQYQFNYKGDDGDHPASYNVVVSGAIESTDWQVPLNQIDIQVQNNSDTDSHKLALVVFKNAAVSDDEDRWVTYHFDAAASTATNSLSLATNEWHENGASISDASTKQIPVGQHAVFVMDSAGSVVEKYDRLLVIPNATQPVLQFEVN